MFYGMSSSIMAPPDVDLRVRAQPAQSVSTYTSMASNCCFRNMYTSLGVPRRYLLILFKAFQLMLVGAAIDLQTSLAANITSILSADKKFPRAAVLRNGVCNLGHRGVSDSYS